MLIEKLFVKICLKLIYLLIGFKFYIMFLFLLKKRNINIWLSCYYVVSFKEKDVFILFLNIKNWFCMEVKKFKICKF